MASSIKLTNANGKVLTLSHQDTHNEDNVVDVLSTAYTIDTINDFATVPTGFKTVIVKDGNRGGTFVWSATGTANGGTVFAGATGYWNRQYSGAVNVKWFGAVSNTFAGFENFDSSSAIQSALNIGSIYGYIDDEYNCNSIMCPSNRELSINLKGNSLSSDYIISFTNVNTITIKHLKVNGNKTLGTFTGAGNGVEFITASKINIDNLIITNTSGIGGRIRTASNNIIIKSLTVRSCDKYGFAIEDVLGSGNITDRLEFGSILIEDCGNDTTRYSGFNIGDCDATSGPRNITINSIITRTNGRDGVAIGRNAVTNTTGPLNIQIGNIISYGNTDHGIEIYGAKQVQIDNINSFSNGKNGVYISTGDNLDVFPEYIQITNIVSKLNGYNGLLITGANSSTIGAVFADSNSQSSLNSYSGVSVFSGASGVVVDYAGTNNVKIGTIMCTGASHLRGVDISGGSLISGYISIEELLGSTKIKTVHKTKVNNGSKSNIDVDYPSFILAEDKYIFKNKTVYLGQTLDATIKSIGRVTIPINTTNIISVMVVGTDAALTNRGTYKIDAMVVNTGTACNVIGTPTVTTLAESSAGIDATVTSGGSGVSYINIRVTGVAAITMNWEAYAYIQ